MKKITYSQVGDNYTTKDPIKKLAQTAAQMTGVNLKKHGFREISETRGESAYVWQQGSILMATTVEGLGTKNLVADAMYQLTGKTYYDVIAHDTVATIINDLISVGATPLTIHSYWAIENNDWLKDTKRMTDFINGWKNACDLAQVSWGGGETPTLKGIVVPNTVDLGGSAVGIIKPKKRLITDAKLKVGDRILLLKSNGINANGLSLVRAIAKKLPQGYSTKIGNQTYGEAILQKTNIYTRLLQDLFRNNIDVHYVSNITGHGLRKIMRARSNYSYLIEKMFEPQEVFLFIQKHAGLSDYEMYETFNMGMDYAIFVAKRDVEQTMRIAEKCGFRSIHAGYVEKGKRQVTLLPKKITYSSQTLDLR